MTTTAAPPASAADAPPSSSRTMVQPLTAIRHGDVSTVGGKGANLGEMIAAGFPVPPGFVLPIDAYLQFYEANASGRVSRLSCGTSTSTTRRARREPRSSPRR